MSVKFKITGIKLKKIINAIRDVRSECKLQFYPDGMRVYILNTDNTMLFRLLIESSAFVQYACKCPVDIKLDVELIHNMRHLIDTVMTVSVDGNKIIFELPSGTGFTIHALKTEMRYDGSIGYTKTSKTCDDNFTVISFIQSPKTILSFIKTSKQLGTHVVLNMNQKDGVIFVSDKNVAGDICICKIGNYDVISDDIKPEDVSIRNGYKIEYLMPIFKSLAKNVDIRTKNDFTIRISGDLFNGCDATYYLAPRIIDEDE